ncbi:MAG: ankyrin repeat domain-containing protein [Planctomycetes bacterium]|nr:ankyrin repeat domain-containing protein [Planctomycetota bacterium]
MVDAFASVATDEDWTFLEEAAFEVSDEERGFLDAVEAGDLAQVEQAVREGVSLETTDVEGRPALLLAAQCGTTDVVRKLLELGADPNVCSREEGFEGSTVLMGLVCGFAPRDPDPEILEALLSVPEVDLEVRDEEGWTVLMHAIAAGPSRGDVVQRLLAAGADRDAENLDGESARQMAVERGVALS